MKEDLLLSLIASLIWLVCVEGVFGANRPFSVKEMHHSRREVDTEVLRVVSFHDDEVKFPRGGL